MMQRKVFVAVLLFHILLVTCAEDGAPTYLKGLELFKERLKNNETLRNIWQEHLKQYKATAKPHYNVQLNCNFDKSEKVPESAHEVRPADIKVVGAMGDSITAGIGIVARSIFDILAEDRGHSWSIGGVESLDTVVTLPNMLKKFNPALEGFAFGEGGTDSPQSRFNIAEIGHESSDMYAQAERLVKRIREDNGVQWYEDWKLVTVFIGGNDLCNYCDETEEHRPDQFIGHLTRALNYLHGNMPRTIVFVNTLFDITALPAFAKDNLGCEAIQGFVCNCAADEYYHPQLRYARKEYDRLLTELVASGKYDRKNQRDFTVVLQTQFKDSTPPKGADGNVDKSFWAIDCFHPGKKAHYAFATALWNNMLQPVGNKSLALDWTIGGNLKCPNQECPYIFTRLNSETCLPLSKSGKQNRRPQESVFRNTNIQSSSGHTAIVVGSVAIALLVTVLVGTAALAGKRYVRHRRDETAREGTINFSFTDRDFVPITLTPNNLE